MNWIRRGQKAAEQYEKERAAAASITSTVEPRPVPSIPVEIAPALQAALLEFANTDAEFQLVARCDRNTADRVGMALRCKIESIIVGLIEPYIFKDRSPVTDWFNDICAEPGPYAHASARPLINALCENLGTELAKTWREENGCAV